MKRLLTFSFVLVVSIALASCTDNVLTPSQTEDASGERSSLENVTSTHQPSPHTVLSRSGLSRAQGLAKRKGPKSGDGFSGPLFGLATAPNGDILVADAGAGVVTLSGATEMALPGISDMGPIGRGSVWATEGLTGPPGEDTGQGLYRASKGNNRLIADLYEFEKTNNPDGADLIDSNPFDVHPLGGQSALVVDAGGNTLLRVDNQGNVEVVAVFPEELVSTDNIRDLLGCAGSPPFCNNDELPAQAVPTSVAVGPDGNYYVGELKGFPAPAGASNIWRISPDASEAECGSSPDCEKVFDGGFTSIIDLRFDASGTLHVAELDEKSWYAVEFVPGAMDGGTINACDVGAASCTEVATDIPILTAITFGKDGSLWATKNALIPGTAEVIEIE